MRSHLQKIPWFNPLWIFIVLIWGNYGCAISFPGNDLLRPSRAPLLQGEQLFHEGKLNEAEAVFSEALQEDPHQPTLLNGRGYVYAKQGEWGRAIMDFEHAVRLVPHQTRYAENLGIAYLQGGFPEKALQAFSQVLGRQPASPQTLNGRGLALSRLRRYQEAIRDFSNALQFDGQPGHQTGEIYLNRAVAYVKSGLLREAKRDLDQAIYLNGSLGQAYESRGLLALMAGETPAAIEDLTTAISLGSDGGLVHYNLGVALLLAGDRIKADKEYHLACKREVLQACGKPAASTALRPML